MRSNTLAFALALIAATPAAPASASLSDFRLPANPAQQQPPPDLQGPVAPDVPASRRPPPTPTPTADQVETPAPATPPVEVPTTLRAAPAAPPPRAATRGPTATPTAAATVIPLPEPSAVGSADLAPTASVPAPPDATPAAGSAALPSEGGWWLWLLAAVALLLAALGAVGWGLRRWARRPSGPVLAPQIERPRVGPAPERPHPPPVPATPGEPLHVSLEPLRLSLTLMNATLAYRLELANHGAVPLTGLTIGADMISAHASMSREEQLSGPRAAGHGGQTQRIDRLEPGESRVVEGEFRLPFPQIVPIRQGNAALLLPLARFRVETEGAGPVVRTFVVGQPGSSPGAGLQPFRLDQGPRVYPRLAQHAFA